MAALIAVGIGLGAEKLGRKISEKRLERKEKKTAAEREAMYGSVGPSSPSLASARATQDRQSGNDRKRAEARRELDAARRHDHYESRRSLSEERYSEDGPPPPRYEDVVRQDARRAGN